MSSQGELHSAPEGGGAALFQEVAVGHLEAVVLAVVGDGAIPTASPSFTNCSAICQTEWAVFTRSAATSSGRSGGLRV